MASNLLINHSGNTRAHNYPFPSRHSIHDRSTGLISLSKIIKTICSISARLAPPPPPPPPPTPPRPRFIFDFDLNELPPLSPPPSPPRMSGGENNVPETEIVGGEEAEKTEIGTVLVPVPVPRGKAKYLDMLVDAANLISAESEEERKKKDPIPGKKRRSKRLRDIKSVTEAALKAEEEAAATVAAAAEEGKETGRVTRSRSGSCQVVPRKYRKI